MHELIFATNNSHKIAEIQSIIGKNFTIKSLQQIGCDNFRGPTPR